jgi:hypothetical protein
MNKSARYGYCPRCGAVGVQRERRMGGNDTCENGHTYPSHTSITQEEMDKQAFTAETNEEVIEILKIK